MASSVTLLVRVRENGKRTYLTPQQRRLCRQASQGAVARPDEGEQ
jgi:hypothetical protein